MPYQYRFRLCHGGSFSMQRLHSRSSNRAPRRGAAVRHGRAPRAPPCPPVPPHNPPHSPLLQSASHALKVQSLGLRLVVWVLFNCHPRVPPDVEVVGPAGGPT